MTFTCHFVPSLIYIRMNLVVKVVFMKGLLCGLTRINGREEVILCIVKNLRSVDYFHHVEIIFLIRFLVSNSQQHRKPCCALQEANVLQPFYFLLISMEEYD